MRAMDVMTPHVITVDPDTSVQALARLLSERGISGVPVVDRDERLVGTVSEGDLLHRPETGTERRIEHRRSRWLDRIASDEDLAREYTKSHGRKVKDVTTSNVISVTDTMELTDVATLLETKRIKRVPVVRDGKIIGIISRANLVRALAATGSEPATVVDSDDRTIRDKLLAELMRQEWFKVQQWFKIWAADVIIKDGVVHFWLSNDQKRRGGRCASRPKTSQEFGESKSTSSRLCSQSCAGKPVLHLTIGRNYFIAPPPAARNGGRMTDKITYMNALLSAAWLTILSTGAVAEELGETLFKKNCAVCHTVDAGKNKIGPSLAGVVGRKAGSVPGFAYSAANKNSGDAWDEQTLDTYLTDPRKFMPGTKMVFAGLKNPEDRKALIEYLKEQH
jgi:cytochrome c2/CBS domain-containing protein